MKIVSWEKIRILITEKKPIFSWRGHNRKNLLVLLQLTKINLIKIQEI